MKRKVHIMAVEFPRGGSENGEIENAGEAHLPCVVLVDTSNSMSDQPIRDLNQGLQSLKNELDADNEARGKVEVCIIQFDNDARIVQPFTSIYDFNPPSLDAGGTTHMYSAVDMAIEEIQVRRKQYKTRGVSSYKPWVFLLTDGEPYGEGDNGAFERLKHLQIDDKWNYIPVAVGPYANQGFLKASSANNMCLVAGIDNFAGVFRFLSDSLSMVSGAKPGQTTNIANPADYQISVNA